MIQPPSKMISVLLLGLCFAGGYFYYSEFLSDPEPAPPLPDEGKVSLESLANIKLDF